MKWVLAGIGLLLVIVVFSLAALDQKDVVWVGGKPFCPHCRLAVPNYSSVCAQCRHAFDWQTHDTECEICLSEFDAEYYGGIYEKRKDAFPALLKEKGATEEQVKDLVTLMESLKTGACGFCGGTGKWLAGDSGVPAPGEDEKPEALTKFLGEQLEGICPVCFGSGRCVLCDGRHRVTHGRETAAVESAELNVRLAGLDRRRDAKSMEQVYLEIRNFARKHTGRAETANLGCFDRPALCHGDRAAKRLAFLRQILDTMK